MVAVLVVQEMVMVLLEHLTLVAVAVVLVLKVVLAPDDRIVLHERIERRFDQMLAQGFLDEARGLMADPRLHPDLPSMRAVGYRQAWQHLAGTVDFGTFRAQAVAATRQAISPRLAISTVEKGRQGLFMALR